MNKFDSSQVRKSYHKMVPGLRRAQPGSNWASLFIAEAEATFVHPDKLGREPTDADRARAAATFRDGLVYRVSSIVGKKALQLSDMSQTSLQSRPLKRLARSHCQ